MTSYPPPQGDWNQPQGDWSNQQPAQQPGGYQQGGYQQGGYQPGQGDYPQGGYQGGGYQQGGYPPGGYPPAGYQAGGYPSPASGLPQGVVLASRGRRVGAYFLAIPLAIVTLGIGYVIWGAIVWGKGTSPALQVLGCRAWKENEARPASWGTMALRDIIGQIAGSIFGIMALISFVLFLSDDRNRSIPDRVAGTIIVHDPNKVLG